MKGGKGKERKKVVVPCFINNFTEDCKILISAYACGERVYDPFVDDYKMMLTFEPICKWAVDCLLQHIQKQPVRIKVLW